jgi:hypothetical protein
MRVLEDQIKKNETEPLGARPLRIVIAGGTGQVGNILSRYFHARRHSVVVLSRTTVPSPWRVVAWDGENLREWAAELDGADAVINLAGRSVNCRYSAANQREILESRVKSTRLLGLAIAKLKQPPRVWLNASTATIYRHALDRPMDEQTGDVGGQEANAPATWKFSIDVAIRWEESFFAASTPKTRKVALRSAMTMSPDRGGIFDTLLRLVRFGLGGTARWGGEPCGASAAPESRIYARAARGVGRENRPARQRVDVGGRGDSPAHGNGTHPKEPESGSRAIAFLWIPVSFSQLASGVGGSGATVERRARQVADGAGSAEAESSLVAFLLKLSGRQTEVCPTCADG